MRKLDVAQDGARQGETAASPSSANEKEGPVGEGGKEPPEKQLPCRISIKVRGLEWFVYNRSPAYEAVATALKDKSRSQATDGVRPDRRSDDRARGPTTAAGGKNASVSLCGDDRASGSGLLSETHSPAKDASERMPSPNPDLPLFLNLLPIQIECSKGAMAMGNQSTSCMLVARFKAGRGLIDARASGPQDVYRQAFDFDLDQILVEIKSNEDFREGQLVAGARMSGAELDEEDDRPDSSRLSRLWRRRRAMLHDVYRLVPALRRSVESFTGESSSHPRARRGTETKSPFDQQWLGLPRYLDDDKDGRLEQQRWRAIEYAQVSTIVDCTAIGVSFFWDVPGPVKRPPNVADSGKATQRLDQATPQHEDPVWGMDIRVGKGTIHYSPWVDRRRVELQSVFFPSSFVNSTVTPAPKPGYPRVNTTFKVSVVLNEQVVLRLYTREESKDWRWRDQLAKTIDLEGTHHKKHLFRGRKSAKQDPEIRPAGWLDLTVPADSSLSYTMDMVAREYGFQNTLALDVKSPSMTSSVNHDIIWKSQSLTIDCDLSNPLAWNAQRSWNFNVGGAGFELFLLRDHIFLLTDLINDWGSGSSASFMTFVPFQYSLNLRLMDSTVYFSVNELNIINRPTALEDNAFVLLKANPLVVNVTIPMTNFEPVRNKISFNGQGSQMLLELKAPSWNTQHTFLEGKEVACLDVLQVRGSYEYFTSTSTSLTDTLLLNIEGKKPLFHLHGALIKYFLILEANYFGKDMHFQTLEEYQRSLSAPDKAQDDHQEASRFKVSNDLDVILSVEAEEGRVRFPALLYSARDHVDISVPSLRADLRFTNYYMDLTVSFGPLALSLGQLQGPKIRQIASTTGTQLSLDGLSISGHRLFGIPPKEPTYVCNWDFDVGSLIGQCSLDFVSTLVAALRAFVVGFADTENALQQQDTVVLHDVTFLRAKLAPLTVWVVLSGSAVCLSLDAAKAEFNDLAGPLFSEHISLVIPTVTLACVGIGHVPQHNGSQKFDVESCAYFTTEVEVRSVESKAHFSSERQKQQKHIAIHDSRTHRTPWLLHDSALRQRQSALEGKAESNPPAMPFPPMPEPLLSMDRATRDNRSHFLSDKDSMSTSRRQSSFLSFRDRERRRETSPPVSQAHSTARQRSRPIPPSRTSSYVATPSLGMNSQDVAGPGLRGPYAKSPRAPTFPFLRIHPTSHRLPALRIAQALSAAEDEDDDYKNPFEPPEDSVVRTTIIVSFGDGIRGFLTPEAISLMNRAFSNSQPKTMDRVLDELQHASLGPVLAASKTARIQKVMQIRLDLSEVALRFHHRVHGDAPRRALHDSVDLRLWGVKMKSRLPASGAKSKTLDLNEQTTVYCALRGLNVSIDQSSDIGLCDLAQATIDIEQLLAWVAQDRQVVGQMQFQALRVTGFNRQGCHLASLIENGVALLEFLVREFSATSETGKRHVQSTVHLLATTHQDALDPAALTQASYVLRAASVHPRGSDEWKLMCRIRWISHFVTDIERQALFSWPNRNQNRSLRDQTDNVVRAFHAWRGWDLSDARNNLLMTYAYGANVSSSSAASAGVVSPINARLNAGNVTIILDPGPHESKIYVDQLLIAGRSRRRSVTRSKERDGLVQETVLQIACARTTVHLDWDLCFLGQALVSRSSGKQTPKTATNPGIGADKQPRVLQDVHTVVAIETTDFQLQTVNLRASSEIQSLAASVFLKEDTPKEQSVIGTINADLIQASLASSLRKLVAIELQQSVIHTALMRRPSKVESKQTLRGGAFCGNITLDIREDMLGLLGIIDRVVSDELSYVKGLIRKVGRTPTPAAKREKTVSAASADRNEASISLMLSSYSVSATLLSSLRYVIKGQTARSSIEAKSGDSVAITTDFDVKDQQHSFQNHAEDCVQEISKFGLPPLNGRLSLGLEGRQHELNAFVSVERITMDASELHTLASTFSRREISNFRRNVARDMELVTSNYTAIMENGKSQGAKPPEMSPSPMLLYTARIAAAGVRLNATAGGSSALMLDLDRIHSEIFNRDARAVQPLVFPEIAIHLTSLGVDLLQNNVNGSRASGDVALAAKFQGTSRLNDANQLVRSVEAKVDHFEVNLFPETASMVVDVVGYLQQRFKNFSLSEEIHTFRARRRRTKSQAARLSSFANAEDDIDEDLPTVFFTSMYSIEILGIQVSWRVGEMTAISPGHEVEDLVFSIGKVDLTTRKENVAKLSLNDLQLQMVPTSQSAKMRSDNSALMPELAFNVAYLSSSKERRLAFLAIGKSVDLRLTSQFVIPAHDLQRSIALATRDLREVLAGWNKSFVQEEQQTRKIFGNKRLASLLVDVDFAGAVVHLHSNKTSRSQPIILAAQGSKNPNQQEQPLRSPKDTANVTTLRTPGIAFKVEYQHLGDYDPSLNAEIQVEASSNTLQPSIVPLFLELSSSVREIVQDQQNEKPQFLEPKQSPKKFTDDDFLQVTDPSAILGNCSLNVGLRICKQEFGLSCQPIAKVAASAEFERIYITVNTVQTAEQNRFFAVSALFSKLQASVRHAYSRDPTGKFTADSITLSLMNSRHVSNLKGISAILRFSPMRLFLNARQLNDFLLFREIWLPTDSKDPSSTPATVAESHTNLSVQRYQQVAATGGFPWNATVSFETLDVQVDLGQSLGKASFTIEHLWLSSKKQSDAEQNLCVGFEKIALNSVGRLSGSLELQHLKLRTSIQWPGTQAVMTPLVQASLGFENIHAKAAFEYQAFFVADLSSLDIFMFNVRSGTRERSDRLVAIVNSDKVQAFVTTQSAAQTYSVYQAIQKMVQEKQTAYENSIREIELYYRRRSARTSQGNSLAASRTLSVPGPFSPAHAGVQLQTNVVVSLRAINVGAYPKTFFDSTIFKLETVDASAAFSVRRDEDDSVTSRLALKLGQVRIALSSVPRTLPPKPFEELAVSTVVLQSTGSRGGTILKVPRLVATMRTRQADSKATHVQYGFRSSFEGRVEVGWNINRVNYIRNMWETHSKALNQRLGRNLTQSRVQITGVPRLDGAAEDSDSDAAAKTERKEKLGDDRGGGKKITAVVNMPQSRYTYTALEPPVIETPQLRDMGEATPPLEWIGLHRDRLPNVTHQIVIVPLLEVAREVEDAYGRILGA